MCFLQPAVDLKAFSGFELLNDVVAVSRDIVFVRSDKGFVGLKHESKVNLIQLKL